MEFVGIVQYIRGVVHFRRQFRTTALRGGHVSTLNTVEETVRHIEVAVLESVGQFSVWFYSHEHLLQIARNGIMGAKVVRLLKRH